MDEFEFDKASADRIAKIVQMYPMSLLDCANVLEVVAPLCAVWTPEGFIKRINDVFAINDGSLPVIDEATLNAFNSIGCTSFRLSKSDIQRLIKQTE